MYTTPDVYFKDVPAGASAIEPTSSSVGCMFGVAPAGVINELVKVTSWTEYVNTFANGLESPFMKDQDLSYAVYLFFSNGGKELYVCNVRKTDHVSEDNNAKKATVTDETTGITLTAYAEGAVYNGISLTLKKSDFFVEGTYEAYDAKIVNGSTAVTLSEVTADTLISAINSDITAKYWVVASAASVTMKETTITMAGGQDGIEALADADFVKAISLLDENQDVTLVAIPGRTSTTVTTALLTYCDDKRLFPFIDVPSGSTVTEVKEKRRVYSANGGVLAYPWGYITDPASTDDSLRLVPTCGAMMGLYARYINSKGVWVAPAGINANIKGFVKLEKKLTADEIGQLNMAGVVSIVSKPNIGIVSWGARGLNNDKSMKYVTDVLLNYTIKKDTYNGTQFAVFQPNDEKLWVDISSVLSNYLENLRSQGALKGSADEAYKVICDSSNNTNETIDNGYLYIDVAYAPVKPAEFIIIRLAHQMSTN